MEKITLSKKDRLSVAWRHQFLQGSWNYERMQNGGWCYSIIPAIKKLYPNKDDQIAALKRHMEFYNTHPYVCLHRLWVLRWHLKRSVPTGCLWMMRQYRVSRSV